MTEQNIIPHTLLMHTNTTCSRSKEKFNHQLNTLVELCEGNTLKCLPVK